VTALNFVLGPDSLDLVTDTLCTSGAGKNPFIYTSKAFAVPHLHAAFAATGEAGASANCLQALLIGSIARDISEADPDVPHLYKEAWQQRVLGLRSNGVDTTNLHTTIYHFGWVEADRRIVGYRYKAEDNFVSTRIEDGLFTHPAIQNAVVRNRPGDLFGLIKLQKTLDDRRPREKRAGIGGDFHHLHLTEQGVTIRRVFRSGDFDRLFEEMVSNAAKLDASV
jgi:hypothetical protein